MYIRLVILLLLCGVSFRLSRLWERNRIRRKRGLVELQKMHWRSFEYRVAGRLRMKWRTSVTVWKWKWDGGIDVQGWKDWEKYIIQCKRYWPKTNVPVEVVRDLLGTMVSEKWHKAMIVTTGKLTIPAREFCEKNKMIVVEWYAVLEL